MEKELDWWMYEDIFFVETQRSARIYSLIQNNQCLVVTGPSGVGKTAAVKHVALQLENESYTLILLREANDLDRFYKSGRKTLYVVDDLCGSYIGDEEEMKKWEKLEKDIKYRLEHGNCKLIATCRLQVFHDIKSLDLKLFENECNLISKANTLTEGEKVRLAQKYFQGNADSAKEHLGKYECFPYFCKFYHDNKDKTEFCLQDFLANPFSFLANEVHKLRTQRGKNKKGKLKFCALVLLVISNNNLEESTLERKNKMIFDTLQKCELSTNITGKAIKLELETLIGSFVIKRERSYCAAHDKMFDFLAFYMAVEEKLLDIIILYASENLVCERLHVSVGGKPVANECLGYEKKSIGGNTKPESYQTSNIDCLITIPDDMILKYTERVFSDIKTSDHVENYLSNNRNMKNGEFKNKLLSYIKQQLLEKDETENLIYTASSDFISRILSITTIERIHSDSFLDSYAVEIPENYVHMYIKRVFNDMKRSNDILEYVRNNINHAENAFIDRLAEYMTQISKEEREVLLKEASADFVARIFVVSEQSITRRGSPIDKFHILIPHELLNSYIAKVFADLIKSDDIEIYLQNNTNEPDVTFNEMMIAFMTKLTEQEFRTLLRDRKKTSSSSIKRLFVVDLSGSAQSDIYILKPLSKNILQHIQDKGILNCPECCVSDYIKRMLDYWKSGEVFDVFENVNMKNHLFADLFIKRLHQLDQGTQLQLAATIDNKTKSSTLAVSCHTGNKRLADWCLQNNVDINCCDNIGGSPLFFASWKNYPELVSVLLESNSTTIDVNKCIEDGRTPLFMACAGGLEKIVTMLLGAKGIDVNKGSDEGETPLYIACARDKRHIVALLLQNTSSRIDVNKCTKDGYSPLYEACCQRNANIVSMLLKHKDLDVINESNIWNKTPLMIASENGNGDIVLLLLENNKLEVNKCNNEGETALYVACDTGCTKVVSLLLKSETHNVDVNICSKNDTTAIYAACCRGHTAIVSLILKYKAKEIDFSRSKSLLYTACARGYTDMVSVLLETGKIEVNEVTFWGETPLFASCEKGFEEIVLTLITFANTTIDVNKSTDSGETPLYIACYKEHLNIVSTLIACRNIDVNKCTTIARSQFIECSQGYPNKDAKAYTNKNKVDGNTEAGETPLYRACYEGNLNIVSTLLSCKNIDVNKCTTTGKSPLYIACYHGYTDIVTLLFEDSASKPDVNICTDNGETPLFVSCSRGHENIVRILLERGADHMICTGEGKSPIFIAKEKKYTRISEMLVDKRDSTCD